MTQIKSEENKNNKGQKQKAAPVKKPAVGYEQLPFSPDDVIELTPKLKHIEIANYDFRIFINGAKSAIDEGYYDQAFELLNQAININLQISGPINKEAATCLSMLASIHFKFGEITNYIFSCNQAIQLQTKAVVLYEKLFGKIHPSVAQAYLALYKYSIKLGNYQKAFKYLHRALYIYEIVCGENHPEISNIFMSLGIMHADIEEHEQSQNSIE